jgi:mannose-6-phosphate isomerase-like protein (cupin superfamily)
MTYKPSPKPDFSKSTIIKYAKIKIHLWGDEESGFVKDWIYVSNKSLHQIIFGLSARTNFKHSNEFRTIFGADELLYVLNGTMVIGNPQTGEMHRVEKGEFIYFSKDTWHHAFNYSNEDLQVLEFFSPPPLTGTSGAYAKQKPLLRNFRYGQNYTLDPLRLSNKKKSFKNINKNEINWSLIGENQEQLMGTIVNTKNLKVHILKVLGGQSTPKINFVNHSVFFILENKLKVTLSNKKSKLAVNYKDSVYLKSGDCVQFYNQSRKEASIIVCEGISHD